MIDDEFESVFRRVFEHLMKSMGQIPEGEGTISYWSGSTFGNPEMSDMSPPSNEIQAEVIDLEDRVLFLVEMETDSSLVDVKVEGRTMLVNDQIEGDVVEFDLDYDVDIDNSRVSVRNGIMEIELKKAVHEDGPKEGYLRIEF
jgi:HSP20 family molecular chaperone IbpA